MIKIEGDRKRLTSGACHKPWKRLLKKGYETPATEVVEVIATGMICQSAETEDYVFGNLDEN